MPYLLGAPFLGFAEAGATLDGLLWTLPYTGPWSGSPSNANLAECPNSVAVSTVMGGVPGAGYDVTLEFRGKIELFTYTGGTNDGAYWQVGGAPSANPDGFNIYKLEISDPSQVFYVNRGAVQSSPPAIVITPYQKTIRINGGATVTLSADAVNFGEHSDGNFAVASISVPGVTTPAQPYAGQFIRMSVISIVRA